MKIDNINRFKGGWFLGNFEPSLLKSMDFEVAHQHHKKGVKSTPHIHKISTEYNYIVKGKIKLGAGKGSLILSDGGIFIYEPYDVSNVEFLKNTDLIVIRIPSSPGDKYEV